MKPKFLYKYQPLSFQSLQNLKNNCIYFNDPASFNDPYDTTQPVEIEETDENLINQILFKIPANKFYKSLHDKLINRDIAPFELAQYLNFLSFNFTTVRLEIITKFNIINLEKIVDALNEHFNQNPNDFESFVNYSKDMLYKHVSMLMRVALTEIRNRDFSKIGISCFTEKFDDLLMWAHYADGHKGFCLEYDTSQEPFSKLHKVNYVKSVPKLNSNKFLDGSEEPSGIVEAYLTTKYIDWSHEQEWRVLHKEMYKVIYLLPSALNAVYFGSKMDLVNFEIIALILKGQNPKVKFYQMNKDPSDFKITATEVNYTTFNEAKQIVLNQIEAKLLSGDTNIESLAKGVDIPASKDQLTAILNAIIDDFKNTPPK
ncbi:MAG TPA: DUF2971 domain-containing protein [Saprospiraceae bacterium]|nr:DUF2971 domain-containing protein [Saprospiraceae bacterium]